MARRNVDRWNVRFADIEPDIETFATRFLAPFERHPVTGGFGHSLNPLGRWDYWELGGRFDGVITGQLKRPEQARSGVTSGPSQIRDAIATIQSALAEALDQQLPGVIDVETDENVELVSRLRLDLQDETPRLPGVLVLPPGSAPDPLRWIATWPQIGPSDALVDLDLPLDAG